jgi:hypothetical protein
LVKFGFSAQNGAQCLMQAVQPGDQGAFGRQWGGQTLKIAQQALGGAQEALRRLSGLHDRSAGRLISGGHSGQGKIPGEASLEAQIAHVHAAALDEIPQALLLAGVGNAREFDQERSGNFSTVAVFVTDPLWQAIDGKKVAHRALALAEDGADLGLAVAMALDEPGDGGGFLEGIQILTLEVFDQGDFARIAVDDDGGRRCPAELAQGLEAPLPGDENDAVTSRLHQHRLQQTMAGNRGRQLVQGGRIYKLARLLRVGGDGIKGNLDNLRPGAWGAERHGRRPFTDIGCAGVC